MAAEAKKARKKPVGDAVSASLKHAIADRTAMEAELRQCRERNTALMEAYEGQLDIQNNLMAQVYEAREMARRFRRALAATGASIAIGGECAWLTENEL